MKLKAQPFYFLKTTGEIVFFFLLKCESVRIMILMDDTMIEIMARLHLTDVSTRLIFFLMGDNVGLKNIHFGGLFMQRS